MPSRCSVLYDSVARRRSRSFRASLIRRRDSPRSLALVRYPDDGHIEIATNAAERTLRAVALRRKNYLFVGSGSGGERAVAIYSSIGSAKLTGLDPQTYLREGLTRIADHPNTPIEEPLHWNTAEGVPLAIEPAIQTRRPWSTWFPFIY